MNKKAADGQRYPPRELGLVSRASYVAVLDVTERQAGLAARKPNPSM